jgi:carbamoyl-phosphate synthase large subunit
VLDWIERGDVHLVVNTPTGSGARTDGREIRRAAVAHGIPCLTTLAAGVSAARAIARARADGAPDVLCLQELHSAGTPLPARAGAEPADGARDAGGTGHRPDGAGVA